MEMPRPWASESGRIQKQTKNSIKFKNKVNFELIEVLYKNLVPKSVELPTNSNYGAKGGTLHTFRLMNMRYDSVSAEDPVGGGAVPSCCENF